MNTTSERPFSAATRIENLERLADEYFDIVIIGGGINGCAAARDAALRGYSVALFEKGDFASGTSSRSSRLIHGGLRYLERYQFGLVNESVIERARLLRNARRLVKPLPFLYPVYRKRSPPYIWLNLGLWIYDLMSLRGGRGTPLHRMIRAKKLRDAEPLIVTSDVVGAGRYFDATVNDARLTMLTAKAAHHSGAIVANYAEVVGLLKTANKVRGVQLRDVIDKREYEVKARVVINAAGPWVDAVLGLDAVATRPMLRPTKGAHLIVPWEKIPVNDAIVLRTPHDNRVMFVIPWGDTVIIGTTDTDYSARPADVAADAHDCAYMLDSIHALMPSARLDESDVISAYAGIRPLIAADTENPSSVSREHVIVESDSGLITIAGGKFTTHRAMAEELIDRVQIKLRRDFGIAQQSRSLTRDAPLAALGEVSLPDLPEKTAAHLVEAYGADVIEVLRLAEEHTGLLDALVDGLPYIRAEAIYATQNEMSVSLCDFLIRRTHIVYESRDGGLLQSGAIASDMGALLGWDSARMEKEVGQYEVQLGLTRAFRQ